MLLPADLVFYMHYMAEKYRTRRIVGIGPSQLGDRNVDYFDLDLKIEDGKSRG